jgi:hypothetical protein
MFRQLQRVPGPNGTVAYAMVSQPRRKWIQSHAGVYFVEVNGFIKIGYSSDLRQRMKTMRTRTPNMSRPVGLGYIPIKAPREMRRVEADLHSRFAGDREIGEWFRPSMQLLFTISESQPWPEDA